MSVFDSNKEGQQTPAEAREQIAPPSMRVARDAQALDASLMVRGDDAVARADWLAAAAMAKAIDTHGRRAVGAATARWPETPASAGLTVGRSVRFDRALVVENMDRVLLAERLF